jgi:hypothetical protein
MRTVPGRRHAAVLFSVSAPDLYSAGNPIDKGSIDADSDPARYVAGNSIGKVTIRLSDGKGKHVDTTVTVLPWEPKNFSVIRTTSPPKVKLHWEYEGVPGYIEGFLLFRAKGGQPFVEYSDVLSADMSMVEDPETIPRTLLTVSTPLPESIARLTSRGLRNHIFDRSPLPHSPSGSFVPEPSERLRGIGVSLPAAGGALALYV